MFVQQTGAGASAPPDELRCYLGHRQSGPQGEYYQPNPQPLILARPQKGVSRFHIPCATCGQVVRILYISRNRTKKGAITWLSINGLIDAYFILNWLPRLFSSNPTARQGALIAIIVELAIFGTIFALLALYYKRLLKGGTKPLALRTSGDRGFRSKHALFAEDKATIIGYVPMVQRSAGAPAVVSSNPPSATKGTRT